jgi:hypothetical protein
MIQLNMATGELISSDSDLALMDQQPSYERQTALLPLQPHLFAAPEKATIPMDLTMVDASLFIAGQR